MVAEQLIRQELQVAEVHRVDGAQPLAIEPVNLRDGVVAAGLARSASISSGEIASFLACSIRARASSGGGESASAASR